MISPDVDGRGPSALRLAGIGIASAAVVAALVVVGRVHTVNPAFSLFGRQYLAAVALKAVLAHGRPRPGGAAGAAGPVDLPEAATGGQPAAAGAAGAPGAGFRAVRADGADRAALPDRLRRAADQRPGGGAFAGGMFLLRCVCREGAAGADRRLPRWVLPAAAGTSQYLSSCSGIPPLCGTTTATSCRFSKRRITAVPRLCVRPSASPAAGMNRRAMAERSGRYGEARGRPPCREDGQQGAAR